MKLVVLDGRYFNVPYIDWSWVKEYCDFEFYDSTPPELVMERIKGADAVMFTGGLKVPPELYDSPTLKYIGLMATGFNILDLDKADERGITCTNTTGYASEIVPQGAFALLLEVCNKIGEADRAVREGRWSEKFDEVVYDKNSYELSGKTAGIIGFGKIGYSSGRIASGFNMKVVYDDVVDVPNDFGARRVSRDELFAVSDVILLHTPLLPSTEGMINKDAIAKMKDGVIIINNSRGQVIIEEDLAEALNSGKVGAAGLDVLAVEPIRPDNPLLAAPNVVFSPHLSFVSKESRIRQYENVKDNFISYMKGEPKSVVNHPKK